MGKGFTLVEITIVMLVIGIIAALAIKGKDLVEVANVRSELRKLEKIDLAVKSVILQKGKNGSASFFNNEGYAAGAEIIPVYFRERGLLDNRDFVTYLVPETVTKSVWRKTPYDNASETAISISGSFTPQEACMVEYIMDDMMLHTGRVIIEQDSKYKKRNASTVGMSADNITVFDDCAEFPNVYKSGENEVKLFYRVL
jgi:prepilin-type N-terminal cleavage/methylation domain-containing protein